MHWFILLCQQYWHWPISTITLIYSNSLTVSVWINLTVKTVSVWIFVHVPDQSWHVPLREVGELPRFPDLLLWGSFGVGWGGRMSGGSWGCWRHDSIPGCTWIRSSRSTTTSPRVFVPLRLSVSMGRGRFSSASSHVSCWLTVTRHAALACIRSHPECFVVLVDFLPLVSSPAVSFELQTVLTRPAGNLFVPLQCPSIIYCVIKPFSGTYSSSQFNAPLNMKPVQLSNCGRGTNLCVGSISRGCGRS